MTGIFEAAPVRTHYFVIDALDECKNAKAFAAMLGKLPANFPLRVLLTSRPDANLQDTQVRLGSHFFRRELTSTETKGDIEEFLMSSLNKQQRFNSEVMRQASNSILQKANGSFLWVALVTNELHSAYTSREVQQVIDNVPSGMEPIYRRTLETLSDVTRGGSKDVVRTILTWVVCAVRPLTIMELVAGLDLEFGRGALAVPLDTFIYETCNQLVHIDSKTQTVSARHETLAAFLSDPSLKSEFAVDKSIGHARIADVCLRYLTSPEMQPPQSPMTMSRHRARKAKRSVFAKYACMHFSNHLRRSHSGDASRFVVLCKFLSRNIYSWIEATVEYGGLNLLVSTAKDLRGFLLARAKYSPPIEPDFQKAGQWETDLIRLATQFGAELSKMPHAIFWLIPPFCPKETAVAASVQSSNTALIVRGLSSIRWNDCVSTIHLSDVQPRAIGTSDTSFALGLSDKSVRIYARSTCLQLQRIQCKQAPKIIEYDTAVKQIAVASVHFLEVFQIDTMTLVWGLKLKAEAVAMTFRLDSAVLQLVAKDGQILTYDSSDGTLLEASSLETPSLGLEDKTPMFARSYVSAAISTEFNLVAAAQRGSPLTVFDLNTAEVLGSYSHNVETDFSDGYEYSPPIYNQILFSQRADDLLLAALHNDGYLLLFEPFSLDVMASTTTGDHIKLACSPDGRTIATGAASGTIHIYETDKLSCLYKIIAEDDSIRSMMFTPDSLRFFDIRGSQCNIWEPSVLVRAEASETESASDEADLGPTIVGMPREWRGRDITAIACHAQGHFVVAGKEEGSVCAYSVTTGKEMHKLYSHAKGITVASVQFGRLSQVLVSTDTASRVLVWRVRAKSDGLEVDGPILDVRTADQTIDQILISEDEAKMILSTPSHDVIHDLSTGQSTTRDCTHRDAPWKWVGHPTNSELLLHVTAESVHLHSWSELADRHAVAKLENPKIRDRDLVVKEVVRCSNDCKLLIEFASAPGHRSTTHTCIFGSGVFDEPLGKQLSTNEAFDSVSSHIEHLIGSVGRRMFFLNRERWICSMDVDAFNGKYYQHCCIPDDWFSVMWDLMLKVTAKGDFVFAKGAEIAVIRNALAFKEEMIVGVGHPVE